MKVIVLLSVIALTAGLKVKSQHNPITQQNTDLFKYSPNDIYSLPADIDDDTDKAPVVYNGNEMSAKTTKLENINSGKGKFKVSLKTENGIEVDQVGKLKDEKTFVISGSYKYTGADGKRYRVRYTADELGYHPITELDIEVPDPKEFSATASKLNGIGADLDKNNGFQFLKRPINGLEAPLSDSSNTVVNQQGGGYGFEGGDADASGFSGFGGIGSASTQTTVKVGGAHGAAAHGPSSGAAVHTATFGSSAHGPSSATLHQTAAVSHGPSSGATAHKTTTFGAAAHGPSSATLHQTAAASHGPSSGAAVHKTTNFGAVAHGPSSATLHQTAAVSHGPSSVGAASQKTTTFATASSSGHGTHGSSFGPASSTGNGAHVSAFGSASSSGNGAHAVHGSTSFGTGAGTVSHGVSTFGKGPQTVSTISSVSKGPQTVSFGSVSKGPNSVSSTVSSFGGSGVSVSSGSFAGFNGGHNAGPASGHVSVSAGSGNANIHKTAASHENVAASEGVASYEEVFAQTEHHDEDGYKYSAPTNQYLPPNSQPVHHETSDSYLPPFRK